MLVTDFRIKYILYKLVLAGFQLFDTGRLHPVRERAIRALNTSVDYIETHLPGAIGFETQKELLAYALDEAKAKGHYLEFGVFTGGTMRFMARRHPSTQFHGFDSFEGLPEAWHGFNLPRGTFSLKGSLPRVPSNVTLHKGWFKTSLPEWCVENPGKVAFMHVDCDIYSSAVEILANFSPRLQPGSIIVFDEYFNYPNWENHEYKAWQECVAKHRIAYEYIGFARQQVAVRVTEIG